MARVYAGMSISEFDDLAGTPQWVPETGGRSKAEILMLYRISQWIPSAVGDAQARESERQSKRRH